MAESRSKRSRLFVITAAAGGLVLIAVSIAVVGAADLRRNAVADAAAQPIDSEPPAQPAIVPLQGPWVVAIQPGHWRVAQLPEELQKLRTSTGAQYGDVQEVAVNLAVAQALADRVKAAGWVPVMVPATVPPGLRADAFIALHADWGPTPDRRGWKLSAPWRPSGASTELADALSAAFSAAPNLVHDADGVTVNMRGYFAFSPQRFVHAASEYTPDAIIEMGFLTNSIDRRLLTQDPGFFADIIMSGLRKYFAGRDRSKVSDLTPMQLPWLQAGPKGAVILNSPASDASVISQIDAGTTLMPVDKRGDWYEVFVHRVWRTGWVKKDELVPSSEPFRRFREEESPSVNP